MAKIFIDTNILISAIVFDKNELELIIRCASEGDKMCISEHIMEEATRVFIKKFPKHLEIFESFIEISKIEIINKKLYEMKIKKFDDIRDQYDAHVVACAEASNCKFIITGDKDILDYRHKTIIILKSMDYLTQKR